MIFSEGNKYFEYEKSTENIEGGIRVSYNAVREITKEQTKTTKDWFSENKHGVKFIGTEESFFILLPE